MDIAESEVMMLNATREPRGIRDRMHTMINVSKTEFQGICVFGEIY